jgi:MFS family permease
MAIQMVHSPQTSLTKEQKQAVGLLSIGTFLEYFDLMLYVHMAVLLNELFFPETDVFTGSLLAAFAFCTTFVFRPFGALIFGYIGDTLGRKSTVIITTSVMALACLTMANVPTYEEIGIAASIIVTTCRILQGMSSVGEIVGAELYLTEVINPPMQYPTVSFIAVASVIGSTFALGVASLVTSFNMSWRLAFWMGAAIAVIGATARTTLRETPEFVDAKRRMIKKYETANLDTKELDTNPIINEKVSYKSTFYLFIINCAWPVCFYFAYIHCANLLKVRFGYNAEQVIHHNFIISIIHLTGLSFVSYLSYKIYPLKIIKVKLIVFSLFVLFSPTILNNITTPHHLFVLQSFLVLFSVDSVPAVSIFFRHFPVFKRYTYSSVIYALSRGLMYLVTSFGIIFLTKYCGQYGLLILMIPISLGCALCLSHFEKLDKLKYSC